MAAIVAQRFNNVPQTEASAVPIQPKLGMNKMNGSDEEKVKFKVELDDNFT